MSAGLTIFRLVAPEFASVVDDDVEALLSLVSLDISPVAMGIQATKAVARLVAHELTMQTRDAAGLAGTGAVSSVGTGDLSVSFSGPSSVSMDHEDDYYRQTRHGLAYLQIRDSRGLVGCGVLT